MNDHPMDYREARKLALKLFIVFLGLTAIVAIVCVLGGEFGSLQIKILLTSTTISAASICAMSCAAFIEKKKLPGLGLTGIALSVVSAALVILGVWAEIETEGYWKFTGSIIVVAVAFAHAFLLILPELDQGHRWVQGATTISIGVLALQIIAAIFGEIDSEGYYQILAAVAILVGLGTLVVPILMKLGKGERRELLVLERMEGGLYRDRAGGSYRVTRVDAGSAKDLGAEESLRTGETESAPLTPADER